MSREGARSFHTEKAQKVFFVSSALRAAKAAIVGLLCGSHPPDTAQLSEGIAAWAIVHGIATPWLNRTFPRNWALTPSR
jgi:hypothetical protein